MYIVDYKNTVLDIICKLHTAHCLASTPASIETLNLHSDTNKIFCVQLSLVHTQPKLISQI
jgi:hypothetical protein